MGDFANEFFTVQNAISFLIGILGSVIAAEIVVNLQRFHAPKIAISGDIAEFRVHKERHYSIEVLNQRRWRAAIDINATLNLLTPVKTGEGVLRQVTPIILERSELVELSHRERMRKGAAAFRFITKQDLREMLRAARQQVEQDSKLQNVSDSDREVYFAFRLRATDNKYDIRRIFAMKYTSDHIVEAERYESLDSLEIVRRPQQHGQAILPEDDSDQAKPIG